MWFIGNDSAIRRLFYHSIRVSGRRFFRAIKCTGTETVEDQKVKTAFLPIKESEIELLEATSPDSPIAKFIEKKGEGIHHVAIRVDYLEAALSELTEKGVRLIDQTPRLGAGGARIAFVHPKSTGGILLELSQR